MRRICGDVDRFTGPHDPVSAAEGDLQFALKNAEGLFEIMTVWRRPATRGNVHVDRAEAACLVFAREKDRVSVSNHPNVRELLIGIRCATVRLRWRLSCGTAGACFGTLDSSGILHSSSSPLRSSGSVECASPF